MFLRYNLPGFLWGLLILVLIGLPGRDIPDLSFWSLLTPDKIFHSAIFSVFVLLLIIGFIKQRTFINLHYYARTFAVIIGIVYGGVTELLQMLIFTERTADIIDFSANTIGCIIGLLTFTVLFSRNK